MTKTANERLNDRVQQMLGAQQVQIAQLLAEIEVLREQLAEAQKRPEEKA